MDRAARSLPPLTARPAAEADLPALGAVMELAISQLQQDFLSAEQIASSRAIMGLDRQFVTDGSYFIVDSGERIVGCGGWSRRPPPMAAITRRAETPPCSTPHASRRGCGGCTPIPISPPAASAG